MTRDREEDAEDGSQDMRPRPPSPTERYPIFRERGRGRAGRSLWADEASPWTENAVRELEDAPE
jgi:hypothetical protein